MTLLCSFELGVGVLTPLFLLFAPIYYLGAGTFILWISTIISTIVMGYEGQVYFKVMTGCIGRTYSLDMFLFLPRVAC